MYRVVLVDDEQIILQGLNRAFPWPQYDCQVVGTASDGREGVKLICREKPDIVLTDIRMPNMDGLSMIAALVSEFPRMQIAVLTAFRDFDYAQQALHLGVCRYLLKPSKMEELKEAFQCMTDTLRALPPEQAEAPAQSVGEAGSFLVKSAVQYMRQHYTEHITLCDVADSVYVSQWHLSKLINGHLNQSFSDLLNGMRISRAKELLADPAMRVHEVAEAVGYCDVAQFSKMFKKVAGRSPMEFRDGLKEAMIKDNGR